MLDILKVIFWAALTIMIGWSILSIIFYRRDILPFKEKIALSYPLGIGLVTIEMAVLSFLGVEFSRTSILAWWSPLFIIALILHSIGKGKSQATARRENVRFSLLEKFFIFGISFETLYTFFRALIKPIESYDAVAIYAIKSKIFYLAKAIPKDFFRNLKDFVPHIEYPLLLPLSETYFYVFFGSLNDLLVKIIFPLYYLSILTVVYFVLRRLASRKTSLLATFLLATIPQLSAYGTNGYADIILTFYYSASFFYLSLWMKNKNGGFLALSFIFSILSIWTKTEALMLSAATLAVMAIYIITEGRSSIKIGISYILGLSMVVTLYLYMREQLGLKLHGDFAGAAQLDIKKIPSILYEYQRQFFGPKKWNIIWVVFLALFCINLKNAFSRNMRFVTFSILLAFSGYATVYMMLPQEGLAWHLSTTGSRFLIHFVPVVVLWVALSLKENDLDI